MVHVKDSYRIQFVHTLLKLWLAKCELVTCKVKLWLTESSHVFVPLVIAGEEFPVTKNLCHFDCNRRHENLINTSIRTQHRTFHHITIYHHSLTDRRSCLNHGSFSIMQYDARSCFYLNYYYICMYIHVHVWQMQFSLAIWFYAHIKHKYTWLNNQVFAIFFTAQMFELPYTVTKAVSGRVLVFVWVYTSLYVSTLNTSLFYYIHHTILQTCIPTNKCRFINGKSTYLGVE